MSNYRFAAMDDKCRVRVTGVGPADLVRLHHIGDKESVVTVNVNGEVLLRGRANVSLVENGLEYELLDRPEPTNVPGDGQ